MPSRRSNRTAALDPRPLYGSCAWAYDLLVPDPAGGAVGDVAPSAARARRAGRARWSIDAGCGTGRYARGLADAGFRVIGVDRSPALIDEARAASPPAAVTYVCADLAAWRAARAGRRGALPRRPQRSARRRATGAPRSPPSRRGCVPAASSLADARDWHATAARYAAQARHERSATAPGRTLAFSSETVLDHDRRRMLVSERYDGRVDGAPVDTTYDFAMRPWTERRAPRARSRAPASRTSSSGSARRPAWRPTASRSSPAAERGPA